MSDINAAMDAFIAEEVESFAAFLLALAKDRVVARNISTDGALLASLATQAAANELKLLFLDSGRMHDMGAGKYYHKGKFMGSADRVQFLKGRKPSKWYSRLAYGAVYGTLANNIANKFVQEVPRELVKAFNEAA